MIKALLPVQPLDQIFLYRIKKILVHLLHSYTLPKRIFDNGEADASTVDRTNLKPALFQLNGPSIPVEGLGQRSFFVPGKTTIHKRKGPKKNEKGFLLGRKGFYYWSFFLMWTRFKV